MKRKTLYESPSVQEVILDLEQALCASVSNTTKEIGITRLTENETNDWLVL